VRVGLAVLDDAGGSGAHEVVLAGPGVQVVAVPGSLLAGGVVVVGSELAGGVLVVGSELVGGLEVVVLVVVVVVGGDEVVVVGGATAEVLGSVTVVVPALPAAATLGVLPEANTVESVWV